MGSSGFNLNIFSCSSVGAHSLPIARVALSLAERLYSCPLSSGNNAFHSVESSATCSSIVIGVCMRFSSIAEEEEENEEDDDDLFTVYCMGNAVTPGTHCGDNIISHNSTANFSIWNLLTILNVSVYNQL